jgi:hypothetical protein
MACMCCAIPWSGKPVLIHQNNSSAVSGELEHAHVEFNLNDPALVGFLFSKGLVQHSYTHFQEVPELLDHQLDLLLANASLKLDQPVELIGLDGQQAQGSDQYPAEERPAGRGLLPVGGSAPRIATNEKVPPAVKLRSATT